MRDKPKFIWSTILLAEEWMELGRRELLSNPPSNRLPISELPNLAKHLSSKTNQISLTVSHSPHLPKVLTLLGDLPYLKYLDLTRCPDKTLPAEISKLKNLRWLCIEDTQFETLPPEIGLLTKLKDLIIRRNKLISLPKELGKLKELKSIDAHDNQLASIPAELGWTNLEDLDLGQNQLTEIPEEIGEISSLLTLSLWGNPLKTLPAELAKCTRLEKLYLYWDATQVNKLPVAVAKLYRKLHP